MLKELDLEGEMQWVETKTGVYTDGKLYSVSNALEFLQFVLKHIFTVVTSLYPRY